jgi:hypothetical protein
MALLMVMIGMVVCTILTAGFLASQGTSIGIARNERDAAKCHGIAKSGIDMCYWLIKNKADWRTTMNPGTWLSNAAIGDGTVTVTVADGDGTNNFADDTTQPVTLTSTGTYDNRTFTLTASVRPTGGGTVFYNGNFISGTISVGNGDLLTASTIDSYNSSIGSYNALTAGSNAAFGSITNASNALTVYFPSVFKGSYVGAPNTLVSSLINLVGILATGPSSVSSATENRVLGYVVSPNTTNLAYRGSFSWISQMSSKSLTPPGRYDSLTVTSATVNVTTSGVYHITGNMTVGGTNTSILNVNDGVSAVFVVDGNVVLTSGQVRLAGTTSQLAIYTNGNYTQTAGVMNNSTGTSRFTLFGTPNGGNITISGNAALYGAIFAPQSRVTLQTSSPQVYGAIAASQLILKDSSKLHFDEALRSLKISNITGGSAPGGTADYRISITGGPGVNR